MRCSEPVLAALAMLLTGCTVGPNFVRPTAPLPSHWSAQALQAAPLSAAVPSPGPAAAAANQPAQTPPLSRIEQQSASLESWWTQFHDPTLSSLIARALQANLNVRVAVLRTAEALAQRDINAAALWPELSANTSYDRERISESTPEGALLNSAGKFSLPGVGPLNIPNPYNQYQLGASASWELDLFGRLRRTLEAASAAAQVSLEDQRSVQLSLIAEVAQNYIALRGAQARRAIALQNLGTIADLLQLTQQRHQAGLNTELDVRNATAQLSQTRATLPQLQLEITRAIHELSNLLGRQPEALRGELDRAGAIPPVPPRVPIGLPAELARRRPDIREAEANLHAATAQIGVAIGDLFPRLTLAASGGFQSETAVNLARWTSLFGSVGPQLDIPVFSRGIWGTIRLDKLRAREAALSYQSTVLNALYQVEDDVAAYNADQQQRQWLTDTVAQNQVVLSLARQRYQEGMSDFLTVLDAERTLQQNQLSLLASTTAVSTDLMNLYRALGGGWNAPPVGS